MVALTLAFTLTLTQVRGGAGVRALVALAQHRRQAEGGHHRRWRHRAARRHARRRHASRPSVAARCYEPHLDSRSRPHPHPGKLPGQAQEHAAILLASLTAPTASFADVVLEASAAAAAGSATRDSGATLVVRAGGIPPLVALLRSGSSLAKRHAANALAQIATAASVQGRHAILARAGAVCALIDWLPAPAADADAATGGAGGVAGAPAARHDPLSKGEPGPAETA